MDSKINENQMERETEEKDAQFYIDELDRNLASLKTNKEKEEYLLSLLME